MLSIQIKIGLIFITSTLLILGMSTSSYAAGWHTILGSNWGWDNKFGQIIVEHSYQEGRGTVRLVTMPSEFRTCTSARDSHIEFNAYIDKDSVEGLTTLLEKDQKPCTDSDGRDYPPIIYLDAVYGGEIKWARAMSNLLKKFKAQVIVSNEQGCYKECVEAIRGAGYISLLGSGHLKINGRRLSHDQAKTQGLMHNQTSFRNEKEPA